MSVPGLARAQYVGHVSSFIMNAKTGAVLAASDADLQRYPASLTKLMTLYLTFQALRSGRIMLDDEVPVSIHASIQEPSKLGLVPGSSLTVEQAILALVTKSANDAACALGEFLGGGSEERFAAQMTRQARALGMSNTTFRNASGLPDPDQVTTAHDLGLLARHIYTDFPQYYPYFNTRSFRFHRHVIPNHDPLLKFYAGADGLKTGYTKLAGHNLVSSVQQGDVRLIGVVMGALSNASRNAAMTVLLDQGFMSQGQSPLPLLKPLPGARSPAKRMIARHRTRKRHSRRLVVLATYHHKADKAEVAQAPASRRSHAAARKSARHSVTASHRGRHRS